MMSFFINEGYFILELGISQYIEDNENMNMPDIITEVKKDGQKVYSICEKRMYGY